MATKYAKKSTHPLDKATTVLYAHLERLGPTLVRRHYQQQEWDVLGRYEFCNNLGSPDAATNFFLTALELWLSQQVDSAQ